MTKEATLSKGSEGRTSRQSRRRRSTVGKFPIYMRYRSVGRELRSLEFDGHYAAAVLRVWAADTLARKELMREAMVESRSFKISRGRDLSHSPNIQGQHIRR